MEKIILASKSPRRKQILELAEIKFEIASLDTDETFPSTLSVKEVPGFIAQKKAQAMHDLYSNCIIISADTIVTIDEKIIGKPKNKEDAIQILKTLSGRTHHVITGVCIKKEEKEIIFSETTAVEFDVLTLEEIEHYVEKYRPYDKAGAYAIQEWIGVIGIKNINGCYYNVMGLPMNKLLKYLAK